MVARSSSSAVSSTQWQRWRDLPGVVLKDLPRYRRAFERSGAGFESDPDGWISLCNRNERLLQVPGQRGFQCDFADGTTLHAPQVWHSLARRMLASALAEWPIEFAQEPVRGGRDEPEVSVIFTHSGADRLPLLLRTIETVNAQREVACECIVVDQSKVPVRDALPRHVRHIWLDNSALEPGWRKSWGYNVGARAARGDILLFQDGDVLMPARYAAEVWSALRSGHQAAASLQRFLFYFDQETTRGVLGGLLDVNSAEVEQVRHNWKGGTIAIRRDAFFDIGGFDEGFVDWGGEDDEFYDRCAEVGHRRAGYIPFVHLWHAPQQGRATKVENENTKRVMPSRMALTRAARINELKRRQFGQIQTPSPTRRYGWLAVDDFL